MSGAPSGAPDVYARFVFDVVVDVALCLFVVVVVLSLFCVALVYVCVLLCFCQPSAFIL